jgi:hypothetical protein
MQEQTHRKFVRALELITDYRDHNIGLKHLVDSLEGILLSLDEPMPASFYSIWHKSWAQLEIALALEQEDAYQSDIQKQLENLERIIAENVSRANDDSAS